MGEEIELAAKAAGEAVERHSKTVRAPLSPATNGASMVASADPEVPIGPMFMEI
jgi:hypothetical protein